MKKIVGNEPWQEEQLYIVEVYYNTSDGSIIGWTEQETAFGADIDELKQTLEWMTQACDKPVLDEAELLAESERLREEGADPHEIGIDVVDIHSEATVAISPEVT